MKRIIALLLVLCMLGIALIACGKKEPAETKPSETPAPTEAPTNKWGESDLGVDVPTKWKDVRFDGESLTILVLNDEKVSREWGLDEATGDDLDEQIALRNELVAGNLELDINFELTGTCEAGEEWGLWHDSFVPYITQDIDNHIHELDAVANFGFSGMTLELRQYYVNLLDKDTLPHFDFSLPCWNQDIIKNGTLNGQLYLVAGDINLSLFNAAMVMWHNIDLYDQVKDVENGDPEDIQDLVMAGKWDYNELYKWSGFTTAAGDGAACANIYGVYIGGNPYPTQPNDAVPYAWAVEFFTKNDDGTFSYNMSENAKAEEAIDKLRQLHDREGNLHFAGGCTCGNHFINGGTIFNADVLYWTRSSSAALRDMEDKYALIPWPKYDAEEQAHYTTTSQDYFTTMSILDHSESTVTTKGAEISAYLQYANEHSYDEVRGYYFHVVVKNRMLGTDDSDGHVTRSWNIFEEIVDNLQFNFGTIYGQALEHILAHVWRTNVGTDNTIANAYDAGKDLYDQKLQQLHEDFGLVEVTEE